MATQNPKIIEASDHMIEACRQLARAELALGQAGDVSLGIHITLLNNLGSMIRNLDGDMRYGAGRE